LISVFVFFSHKVKSLYDTNHIMCALYLKRPLWLVKLGLHVISKLKRNIVQPRPLWNLFFHKKKTTIDFIQLLNKAYIFYCLCCLNGNVTRTKCW